MVTIHTHRGLYSCLRLPYGISSAPALFQQVMELVLADLDHVEVYFDDILVTVRNEEEHLQTLAEVLERLEASWNN